MTEGMAPAEELRVAAKTMRDRAQAATEGPWAWEATGDKDSSWAVGLVRDEDERMLTGEIGHGEGIIIDGVCESIDGRLGDGEHIASWSPPVALAVADWLEKRGADYDEMTTGLPPALVAATARTDHALKVARAYLGESTDES